jgi:hypothetical protein
MNKMWFSRMERYNIQFEFKLPFKARPNSDLSSNKVATEFIPFGGRAVRGNLTPLNRLSFDAPRNFVWGIVNRLRHSSSRKELWLWRIAVLLKRPLAFKFHPHERLVDNPIHRKIV